MDRSDSTERLQSACYFTFRGTIARIPQLIIENRARTTPEEHRTARWIQGQLIIPFSPALLDGFEALKMIQQSALM
jgi:hypothetical protein